MHRTPTERAHPFSVCMQFQPADVWSRLSSSLGSGGAEPTCKKGIPLPFLEPHNLCLKIGQCQPAGGGKEMRRRSGMGRRLNRATLKGRRIVSMCTREVSFWGIFLARSVFTTCLINCGGGGQFVPLPKRKTGTSDANRIMGWLGSQVLGRSFLGRDVGALFPRTGCLRRCIIGGTVQWAIITPRSSRSVLPPSLSPHSQK